MGLDQQETTFHRVYPTYIRRVHPRGFSPWFLASWKNFVSNLLKDIIGRLPLYPSSGKAGDHNLRKPRLTTETQCVTHCVGRIRILLETQNLTRQLANADLPKSASLLPVANETEMRLLHLAKQDSEISRTDEGMQILANAEQS
jgi:hypothetical protein